MTFVAIKRGLGERLKEAREKLGYTQKAFADLTEIPLPSLKDYEGGKSIPGGDALARIAFIGVSTEWLFFAEGAPITRRQAGAEPANVAAQPRAGYVYLPLYDVRAAAGKGALVEDAEHQVDALAFKEDWIRRELRATPADLRLIYVEGDSMEPDLRAGDIVLIDHTDTRGRREGIYVIRMNDALLVKQLQRLPGGVVRLTSRNPAYEPFTVAAEQLEAQNQVSLVGRVVWACRRF